MMPGEPSARSHKSAEPSSSARSSLDDAVEQLSARIAVLEEEKAALEAFAAVAAHELVVPLIMTESYAAMLTDRLSGDEYDDVRSYLDTLARGAAQTRMLIELLLEDARSRERPLVRREVDLKAVVRRCVALMQPELDARGAQVDVGDLPVLPGEEPLLASVFTNLIFNALKYSPRRTGLIRIDAARELGQWRLTVRSEGPTIPLEDRTRIFEPFQRVRRERRKKGAGLGLAICRRIIERHGGAIGVTGANGSGNAFYFTLPSR
jgi:signal transduction histidine kinase